MGGGWLVGHDIGIFVNLCLLKHVPVPGFPEIILMIHNPQKKEFQL